MDAYIGTIVAWAGTWIPKDWMPCDGRELLISQYAALFAIIGTRFGSKGFQTFALPNFKHPDTPIQYIICVNGIFPPQN